jgi:hypothetical protein
LLVSTTEVHRVTKGQSDRGVRTEDSGVEEEVPVTDAVAGDEGIDDGLAGEPFKPGKRETYVVAPASCAPDTVQPDVRRVTVEE